MGWFKQVLSLWVKIFKDYRYIVILILFGFLFYLINGLLLNVNNIKSAFQIFGGFNALLFILVLSLKFIQQISLFSAIGTILLSFLVGMLFSLLFYRFNG